MTNNSKTKIPDVFDINRIEKLVDLMKSNDLSEIILQQADIHIELKRNITPPINSFSVPQVVHQTTSAATPTIAAKQENISSKENEKEIDDSKSHIIKSPMVGTFYASSSPDSPPLVKVGDPVTPDKTICLIEAMKVFNEIQAECTGKIIAILVKNGEAVEYGKPLFRIATE
ncbi:MAG: acetyl-CoA carboxylase biotin carboxyl carrier protein [Planctomycetaceae bacterium]|jgi:acetyl-CoA carboxylase biotin carboxyl carrier protein|nr:acetyl-CoA carboxylase biotin carboxyl carrier protein [Planctomycetaceae bacterium]